MDKNKKTNTIEEALRANQAALKPDLDKLQVARRQTIPEVTEILNRLIPNVDEHPITPINTTEFSDPFHYVDLRKRFLRMVDATEPYPHSVQRICLLNAAQTCFGAISALLATGNYMFAALMTAIGFGFSKYETNFPGRYEVLTDECLAALFTKNEDKDTKDRVKDNILKILHPMRSKSGSMHMVSLSLFDRSCFDQDQPTVSITIGRSTIKLEAAKFSFFGGYRYPIMVLPFFHKTYYDDEYESKILLVIITIGEMHHVYGILDNFIHTY